MSTEDQLINTRRLFVHNLDFKMSQSAIRDIFADYGRVVDCHVPLQNGKPRGYALIEFSQDSEARYAMDSMNQKIVSNRKIVVTVIRHSITHILVCQTR